jgi:hypothetical protein
MPVTQPVQIDLLPPDLNVDAWAAMAEALTVSETRYLRGPTLAPHKTACGSRLVRRTAAEARRASAGVIQPRLGGWDFLIGYARHLHRTAFGAVRCRSRRPLAASVARSA